MRCWGLKGSEINGGTALLASFHMLSEERLWSHLVTIWDRREYLTLLRAYVTHHKISPKSFSSWFPVYCLQMLDILEENLSAIYHTFLREQINFPGILSFRCSLCSHVNHGENLAFISIEKHGTLEINVLHPGTRDAGYTPELKTPALQYICTVWKEKPSLLGKDSFFCTQPYIVVPTGGTGTT